MKFIEQGNNVKILIAKNLPSGAWQIKADFHIEKEHFEEFLDHVIEECKKAYKRDELFPPIKTEELNKILTRGEPDIPPPPGGMG